MWWYYTHIKGAVNRRLAQYMNWLKWSSQFTRPGAIIFFVIYYRVYIFLVGKTAPECHLCKPSRKYVKCCMYRLMWCWSLRMKSKCFTLKSIVQENRKPGRNDIVRVFGAFVPFSKCLFLNICHFEKCACLMRVVFEALFT